MRLASLLAIILAACVLLTACAVSDKPAIERPPLTLEAPPPAVFNGLCDDTTVLEGWLQPVTLQWREFGALMDGAAGKSSDDLYFDVVRMVNLRNVMGAVGVPDCAQMLYPVLLETLESVLVPFHAYVNGESVDIDAVLNEVRPQFAEVDAQVNALLQRLEAQYRAPDG